MHALVLRQPSCEVSLSDDVSAHQGGQHRENDVAEDWPLRPRVAGASHVNAGPQTRERWQGRQSRTVLARSRSDA